MVSQSTQKTLNTNRYREALRLRVIAALGPGSVRWHSEEFGVNHETLRRWLRGKSLIPAWFVAEVAIRRRISASALLLGADGDGEPLPDPKKVDRVDSATLNAIRSQIAAWGSSTNGSAGPVRNGR